VKVSELDPEVRAASAIFNLQGAVVREVIPPRGFHTIDAAGAASVTAKQKGQCRAFVPADWQIVGTRDAGGFRGPS